MTRTDSRVAIEHEKALANASEHQFLIGSPEIRSANAPEKKRITRKNGFFGPAFAALVKPERNAAWTMTGSVNHRKAKRADIERLFMNQPAVDWQRLCIRNAEHLSLHDELLVQEFVVFMQANASAITQALFHGARRSDVVEVGMSVKQRFNPQRLT